LWLGAQGEGPEHSALIEIDAMADKANRSIKSAEAITLSAHTGQGIGALIDAIILQGKAMLPPLDGFAVNMRQRGLVQQAADRLCDASAASDWLIVGENLRLARLSLDALTGRAHTEDLLDNIFGAFCIGK
jgi:tRNA modification GTPase